MEAGDVEVEWVAVTQMHTEVNTALSAGYQLCVLPGY